MNVVDYQRLLAWFYDEVFPQIPDGFYHNYAAYVERWPEMSVFLEMRDGFAHKKEDLARGLAFHLGRITRPVSVRERNKERRRQALLAARMRRQPAHTTERVLEGEWMIPVTDSKAISGLSPLNMGYLSLHALHASGSFRLRFSTWNSASFEVFTSTREEALGLVSLLEQGIDSADDLLACGFEYRD